MLLFEGVGEGGGVGFEGVGEGVRVGFGGIAGHYSQLQHNLL